MILPDGRRLRLPWAKLGAALIVLVILANYGLGGVIVLLILLMVLSSNGADGLGSHERSV